MNLNLNPALKQYLLASLGASAPVTTRPPAPAVTVSKQTPPNFQSLSALASLLASSGLAPTPKPQPSTSSILSGLTDAPSNGGVDFGLLNNLAMALQLLIVSNLLSSPQETQSEPVGNPQVVVPGCYELSEPVQPVSMSYAYQYQPSGNPAPQKQVQSYQYETPSSQKPIQSYQYEQPAQYSYPQTTMPNANFVGSATFGDPFMGSVPPASGLSSSRSGYSLMSPYEALSPSSPFSDPILSSPYGSIMTSKKYFQSPYSSIMATDSRDFFSMSDFF